MTANSTLNQMQELASQAQSEIDLAWDTLVSDLSLDKPRDPSEALEIQRQKGKTTQELQAAVAFKKTCRAKQAEFRRLKSQLPRLREAKAELEAEHARFAKATEVHRAAVEPLEIEIRRLEGDRSRVDCMMQDLKTLGGQLADDEIRTRRQAISELLRISGTHRQRIRDEEKWLQGLQAQRSNHERQKERGLNQQQETELEEVIRQIGTSEDRLKTLNSQAAGCAAQIKTMEGQLTEFRNQLLTADGDVL